MKKGWEIKKLGDICNFQGGSQPPKSHFIYEPRKGYVRFLQIRDFASDKNITYIPESKKNRYCNEDDILLGRYGASVGKVLINKSGAYNVAVMKTIPDESILFKRYLYYYLNTEDFQTRLLNTASRSAQDGFSKDDIFDFPILVPPLPEQKRIVAILDEAFAAIATAKAHAEQNLRNARELFESHLQGVFENGDWENKRLSEVAKHSLGKMLDKSKNKGEPKKYLRNQNVRWFEFEMSDLNEMLFLESEKEKYMAIKGDVLICEGGYPGRAAMWEEDYPIYFQKAIHRVRFHAEEYNKWFLFYLFMLDRTGRLKNHFTGTGIQHFTGDALSKLVVPIPPLNKIKHIVRQLDALRAETQKLEAVYRKKLEGLEELKKSILQQAFAGELTT